MGSPACLSRRYSFSRVFPSYSECPVIKNWFPALADTAYTPASWEEGDIYALLPAEEGIWTAQRLYGQALSDLMGYLVTHLTWDDGTPVVLEQYFDWRAQNDDEVLR